MQSDANSHAVVTGLSFRLREMGYSTFLPGVVAMKQEDVRKEIDNSEVVVIFLSGNSASLSPQCHLEATAALASKGPDRVLVVVLDAAMANVDGWPAHLKPLVSRRFVSMKSPDKVAENFHMFRQSIEEMGISVSVLPSPLPL